MSQTFSDSGIPSQPHLPTSQPTVAQGTHSISPPALNSLGLWNPAVNPGSTQIFSINQQWNSAGSDNNLQTVEVGFINSPFNGTTNSSLFIYWTADNYKTTGCYNLGCGFIQTNASVQLGGTYSEYSTVGGPLYGVLVGFSLNQGKWWLSVGGKWIGYYPTSLFNGGPLAREATVFEQGGEVAGIGDFPPMGNGLFGGQTGAASDLAIEYINAKGKPVAASLKGQIESAPSCYTVSLPGNGGKGVGTYFLFGGPGGTTC